MIRASLSIRILGGVLLFSALGCSQPHPPQISYVQSDQHDIKTLWLVTKDATKKEVALPWLGNTNENYSWRPDGTAMYVWALETPGSECRGPYCIGDEFYLDGMLNLRDAPAGKVIGLLGCGDRITIITGFKIENLDGVEHLWAQVNTSTDANGVWVAVDTFDSSDRTAKSCGGAGNPTEQTETGFIQTEGEGFDEQDLKNIRQAGDNIARAFADVYGPASNPQDAWNTVFGYTAVTFNATGYDCHSIGINYFTTNDFGGCWAVAGANGQIYVSTEFTTKAHDAGEVVEWASHETGHQIDRVMTDFYDFESGYYGSAQMMQFPGGIDAVNAALPADYRQSWPSDRRQPVEVFADAFLCWSHPNCEFRDPRFSKYFNDLMTDFALDRANH